MGKDKLGLLQGTLDLMVLQTLASMGPLHGFGIARLRRANCIGYQLSKGSSSSPLRTRRVV